MRSPQNTPLPEPSLQVICTDPAELVRWVGSAAQAGLHAVAPAELRECALPEGPDVFVGPDRGEDAMVRLPVDGPDDALRLAGRALHTWLGAARGRVSVVADGPDGPVQPRALVALADAGLSVGVDLRRCAWASVDGVWIPASAEVHRIPSPWPRRGAGRTLAGILSVTTVGDDSPVRRWLDEVLRTDANPTAEQWELPLQALYLDAVVAALRGGHASRYRAGGAM